MNYKGKLYGKVGKKYFDTGKTSDDWDEMIDALVEAHKDLLEWNDAIPVSEETDAIIEQIEQALEKAGVQL